MSKEQENKDVVGRWFTVFWGKIYNPSIVDELAASDLLLQYSLHAPRRGHADIKAFMSEFREAFPDLNFWGAADLIAEGARTPVPRSATFWSVRCPLPQVAKCTLPEPQCCGLRTARSLKRSVLTTALPRSRNSA